MLKKNHQYSSHFCIFNILENVTIPPGTVIAIPTYLTNLNPKYWTDPESFKPDRFSKENELQYGLYQFSLFGTGQRTCIGFVD